MSLTNKYGASSTIFSEVFKLKSYGASITKTISDLESHLLPASSAGIIYYGNNANLQVDEITLSKDTIIMAYYPAESWGMNSYIVNVIEPNEDTLLILEETGSVVINTNMPSGGIYTLPSNATIGVKFTFINSSDSGVIINSYLQNKIRYLNESGVLSTASSGVLHSINSRVSLIYDNDEMWVPILENNISYG